MRQNLSAIIHQITAITFHTELLKKLSAKYCFRKSRLGTLLPYSHVYARACSLNSGWMTSRGPDQAPHCSTSFGKSGKKPRVPSKDRFCNTIAPVVLMDTFIRSDWRLQTKEILSTSKSKQTQPQKLCQTNGANQGAPKPSVLPGANSRLVQAKGGF